MQEQLLIIFSRAPKLGMVKSRIAHDLGLEKALSIHNRLFDLTIDLVKETGYPYQVYLSEKTESNKLLSYSIQNGDTLGERMFNAFVDGLKRSAKVCIIGSDCLDITSNDITAAFRSLETSDIVIGPAVDGGYYLIGMMKPYPELFQNINWGKIRYLKKQYIDVIN